MSPNQQTAARPQKSASVCIFSREIATMPSGISPVAGSIPAIPEPARPGSVRRSVLVSDQAALVRMAAGLDFFNQYPYGCTEQRLSQARAEMALKRFRALLHEEGDDARMKRAVEDTLQWVPQVIDPHGLVAYWPGSAGYVSLTAWTVIPRVTEALVAPGASVAAKAIVRAVPGSVLELANVTVCSAASYSAAVAVPESVRTPVELS